MTLSKKPTIKSNLHNKNKNRDRYDLKALLKVEPALQNFIIQTKTSESSIDFSNPTAVKFLNKALLHYYYGIKHWDFPEENLCPPIPGRADYIHQIADLLANENIDKAKPITCLDIGTGASCIYPIIGVSEYKWRFIASDIDQNSIESANRIINANPTLNGNIECRLQKNRNHIFNGIIKESDNIEVSICNPPFHSSLEEARKGTIRKVKNLKGKIKKSPMLNFSGNNNELIYPGGELQFIKIMIKESETFAENCRWFTTQVSKKTNLKGIYQHLDKTSAKDVKTIEMSTGNKITRIVAWTFR